MLKGIRAIRLLESSGHPVLDEAAKASVRRGAPFGRFDVNMKDISELRIIRTWRLIQLKLNLKFINEKCG